MPAKADPRGIEPADPGSSLQGNRPPIASPIAVPPAAKWLGVLGAMPFVLLSGIGHLNQSEFQGQTIFALAAYGAVILSFLGGIHWGLAIAGFGPDGDESRISGRLVMSVVPSLIGWGALFLPAAAGLLVLAAAFAAMLLVDLSAARQTRAPAWYPMLRWPLTLVVVAALTLAALT